MCPDLHVDVPYCISSIQRFLTPGQIELEIKFLILRMQELFDNGSTERLTFDKIPPGTRVNTARHVGLQTAALVLDSHNRQGCGLPNGFHSV